MLLEESNYKPTLSTFRYLDLFYSSNSEASDILNNFLERYYNTVDSDSAWFCIHDKINEIKYKTKTDLDIKSFNKQIFYMTKDDTFININKYYKFCDIIDKSKYYCDYCRSDLFD